MSATAWPPDFDIHHMFGPDLTPPGGLDWNRIQAFARFCLDAFIGQIAIAFGGISIAGWKPFDFLADWGQARIDDAAAAYAAATNAQGSADYANAQLVGLTVTDVAGGVSLSSTFTGAVATNIGGSFTQVYSGPGGGTWGVDGDGNTIWNKSGGQYRLCIARHNTPVTTNYQQIRVVVTSVPSAPNFGSAPANYLCARINSACDSYVYAKISYNALAIGYAIVGAQTNLDSTSFTMNVGDTIDFFVGTDADDREFIVKRNGDVIFSTIDSGAASDMGASNLYVGLGCYAADANTFTDQRSPGKLTAWGGIDRQATTH